jgi:predicted lactoylglutathione lyase
MKLPSPVPELPVGNLQISGTFYEQKMGFRVDWVYEDYLAGISKDAARIFLRRKTEQEEKQAYNVLVWLNLDSPLEVDQLYEEWKRSGVVITDELETKPWNLREFTAKDLDGNRFRVFHDLGPRE